jgi:hypothetical protein
MLDAMENLIQSLAGVGNDIAHDFRTPLTRARLTLERGRTKARTLEAVADGCRQDNSGNRSIARERYRHYEAGRNR